MHPVTAWLSSNAIAALSIFGAAVAFVVSTWQQVSQRKAEANERQFQAFHNLIKGLVAPEQNEGVYYIDRQAAVIFELRHFPRYFEFTERLLVRLRKKWTTEPPPHTYVTGLVEAIDLALKHIKANR